MKWRIPIERKRLEEFDEHAKDEHEPVDTIAKRISQLSGEPVQTRDGLLMRSVTPALVATYASQHLIKQADIEFVMRSGGPWRKVLIMHSAPASTTA